MKLKSIQVNKRLLGACLMGVAVAVVLLLSFSLDVSADIYTQPAVDPWGGNANFRMNQYIPDPNAQSAAAGDVDGDGDLDMVTSSCGGSTLILHNDGDGTFTQAQTIPFGPFCHFGVVVGNLDDDEYPDALLFDNNSQDNRVLWNNDDGSGTFLDGGAAFWSDRDGSAALADLDGDGDQDVFVVAGLAINSGKIRTWKNDGDGNFSLMAEFDDAYIHTGLALGYLNDDNYIDAFTTSWSPAYNKVWLNDGTGAFTETQSIPNANTFGVALADLDGDEDLDAYLAKMTSDGINLPDEVWFNDGTGLFTNSGQSLDTALSVWPALGDLDADGDKDAFIFSSFFGPGADEIWVNDGMGVFTLRRTLDENYPDGGGGLFDVDNDGDLDAIGIGALNGYYIFLNGDWRQAAQLSAPVAAYGYAQCPDQPNSTYIIGGLSDENLPVDNVWRYDADTDAWNALAPLPDYQGLNAPPAVCYAGHIYVVAGLLQVYDIISDSWTIQGGIPRFAGGAAVGAWDGKLYRVGGVMGDYTVPPFNYVDVYDIASGTWEMDGGTPMPQAALLPGYTQIGQYLYLVGGTGIDSPAQNVNILQRYDMVSDTWEQVPFPSARGLGLTLAYSGNTLYAVGGDMDGGSYSEPTDLVETYDLSTWPGGTWEVYTDTYPYPVLGNTAGFCSEVKTGGEIWSVSGASGTMADPEFLHANSYHSTGEACAHYGVGLPPDMQSHGRAGSTIDYTISVTNTGTVADYYDLSVSSNWQAVIAPTGPYFAAPGESIQVVISITIPGDANPLDGDTAVVTSTSLRDPSITAATHVTTSVWYRIIMPLVIKN